jgi:hypothetical protein
MAFKCPQTWDPNDGSCNWGRYTVENRTGEILWVEFSQNNLMGWYTYVVMIPGINDIISYDAKEGSTFPAYITTAITIQRSSELDNPLQTVYRGNANKCKLGAGDVSSANPSNMRGTNLVDYKRKGEYSSKGPCWSILISKNKAQQKLLEAEDEPDEPQELRDVSEVLVTYLKPSIYTPGGLATLLDGCVVRFRTKSSFYYTQDGPGDGFIIQRSNTTQYKISNQGNNNFHLLDTTNKPLVVYTTSLFRIVQIDFSEIGDSDPRNITMLTTIVPIIKDSIQWPFSPLELPAAASTTKPSGFISNAIMEFVTMSRKLASDVLENNPEYKMRCCSKGAKGFYDTINRTMCQQTSYNATSVDATKNCDVFMRSEWCEDPSLVNPDRAIECACFDSADIPDGTEKDIYDLLNESGVNEARKCLITACKQGTAYLDAAQRNAECSKLCVQIQKVVNNAPYGRIDWKGQQTMNCEGGRQLCKYGRTDDDEGCKPDPGTGTPDPGTGTPDPGTGTPDTGTGTSDTGTPDPGTDTPDPGTGTDTPTQSDGIKPWPPYIKPLPQRLWWVWLIWSILAVIFIIAIISVYVNKKTPSIRTSL